MDQQVEWKAIAGFPLYEVSNTGLIRSWHKQQGRGFKPGPPPYILKGGRDKNDYRRLVLTHGPVRTYKKFHTLVMEAFGPPPPFSAAIVRHLDHNKDNNSIQNLSWGTQTQNMRDRHAAGRTHNQISSDQVRRILQLRREGLSYEKIAKQVSCSLAGAWLVSKRESSSTVPTET